SSIEIRPGDPSVVHHVIVQIPEQLTARAFAAVQPPPPPPVDPTRNEQLALAQAAVAQARAGLATNANRGATELDAGQQAVKAVAEAQNAVLIKSADRAVIQQGPGGFSSYNDLAARLRERQTGQGAFMTMEAVYAPGTSPLDFRFTDSAKLIKA